MAARRGKNGVGDAAGAGAADAAATEAAAAAPAAATERCESGGRAWLLRGCFGGRSSKSSADRFPRPHTVKSCSAKDLISRDETY